MITTEQIKQLTALFPVKAHEFKQGYAYLTEDSIADRLDSIDPNWTFEVIHITQRDNQVVAHCRLTVAGVYRDNTGMQTINEKAGEPEKGAVTDGFKRCARLFGIGRYLLDLPNSVNDAKTMNDWYKQMASAKQPQGQPQPQSTPESTTPPPDAKNGQSSESAVLMKNAMGAFWGMARQYYDHHDHMVNSVNKLISEGVIKPDQMTVNQAVEKVIEHVKPVTT